MNKIIIFGTIIFGTIVFNVYAQCRKVYYFCTDEFSKEEKQAYWDLDNQSKSVVFNKGDQMNNSKSKYEMDFIAYSEFNYRISVCTDIVKGSSDKATFQLKQDVIVRVKDAKGNTNIRRQKEIVFDSSEGSSDPFVKIKTDKTKKMYLTVDVPSGGESENRKLKTGDNVCVGVLIEHRKAARTGF